jgi:hypothetical protein
MMQPLNGIWLEALVQPKASTQKLSALSSKSLKARNAGPWDPSIRRYLLRRFPFVLIYREQTTAGIQLVAVAHTSRRPNYWKQRI